jgi:transcriptional regulator with XRE-family HTH domain
MAKAPRVRDTAFGGWLRAELDKRGWTPGYLAEKADVPQPNVSRTMSGHRAPSVGFVVRVAGVLKIPPEVAFRAAGILPPIAADATHYERQVAWIQDIARYLTDDELDLLVEQALLLFRRRPRAVPEPEQPELPEPEDKLEAAGIDKAKLHQFILSAQALLKEVG